MTIRTCGVSARPIGHSRKSHLALIPAIVASFALSGCGGGSSSRPISVAIAASTSTVDGTNAVTITASVANDKNGAGVTWTLSGPGALSNQTASAVTFTAPTATSSSQMCVITATSVADASKSGSTTITVPAAPAITTSSLAAGSVGTAYSAMLAGSGGIPPYTWSVSTGTLPTGLSLSAGSGAISGTPMASGAGSASVTFTLTDSGRPAALTATKELGLTVNAAPAITFSSNWSMPDGTRNAAYAATIQATGGAGTLTYSVSSGVLPNGLALSAAGAVTGTPTTVGSFNFVVKAEDAYGDSATQNCAIKINHPAITITTPATLPAAYVGANYSQTLAASGGSGEGFTWALASGSSLPPGLTLSPAGALSGKPTTAATSSFEIAVTDSASNAAKATFSLTVRPGVSITTATTFPVAYVGSNYSQTLAATGGSGTGYTWSVAGGSALPSWLTLSNAGELSGQPAATGTSSFSISVTDSASNTATATFSLTVNPGLTVTTSRNLPLGYQGDAYGPVSLAATGGTGTGYTWSWVAASGSSLPAGLNLSSAGVISGTPTANGTFVIVITVTDSASSTASATFSLTAQPLLSITTPETLPSGLVNHAYSQMLSAYGGTAVGYTWTVTAGAASLSAVNLSLSNGGVLSGTPTTTGTANFTAKVTDSLSHTASADFMVTINSSLAITTPSPLPTAYVGSNYSQTFTASGGTGTGYSWTVAAGSTLPAGLTLSTGGVLSGKPTTAGSLSFSITVTDSASNTATSPFTMTIVAPLAITTGATLPPGYVGEAYAPVMMAATGGSGTGYTWTWAAAGGSSLPAGLSLSTAGVISGTPATAGSYSVEITVADSASNTASGTFTLVVQPMVQITTSTSLPAGTIGAAYSQTLAATGGTGTGFTWSVTAGGSTLIAVGLSLASNGVLSGTPTASGTANFTARVADSAGHTASANFTLTVSAAQTVTGRVRFYGSPCFSSGNAVLPTISLTLSGNGLTRTTSADSSSSGDYSFTDIPNGTYTITPSLDLSGASAVFGPPSYTFTVNDAPVTGSTFYLQLGFTVSGNVHYNGATKGVVYVYLLSDACSNHGAAGTSLTPAQLDSGGAFTIRGVPEGTYTLNAWIDPSSLGNGASNAMDPAGVSSSIVTVLGDNVSGTSVTMVDPTLTPPATAPNIKHISSTSKGVVISYGGVGGSTDVEQFSSYTVQWSTSSSPSSFSASQSATFKATGLDPKIWVLSNGNYSMNGTFDEVNDTEYYFRVRGSNPAGSGPWTTPVGPIMVGGFGGPNFASVSGTVTIPEGITPTGPLYVGYYNENTNEVYTDVITAPVTGSNAYTVNVWKTTTDQLVFFVCLDQNKDGLSDTGDLTNTFGLAQFPVVGTPTVGDNLTLPDVGSNANVVTEYVQWNTTGGGVVFSNYNLGLYLDRQIKLPVSVQLKSAPGLPVPMDRVAFASDRIGEAGYYGTAGMLPMSASNTYAYSVTYSDGTTDPNVIGKVTALLDANSIATPTSPLGSVPGQTQPDFHWIYPANADNYRYSFALWTNTAGMHVVWQIPPYNSPLTGFLSSDFPTGTLAWGTDPLAWDWGGANNPPNPTTLTSGTVYNWSITSMDSNHNSASFQYWFEP